MDFKCCDPDCQDTLQYCKEYKRNIIKNEQYCISWVSAHFKHKNNQSASKCKIESFINNIGSDEAKKFYRKWCEPFIYESVKNCFNFGNKFHILSLCREDIQIITSININKVGKIIAYGVYAEG